MSEYEKRYTIRIPDISQERFVELVDYCRESKLSLIRIETCQLDVSDVSGSYDTIATFRFLEEADAIIFRLKYS